jgi:hypothetical protein
MSTEHGEIKSAIERLDDKTISIQDRIELARQISQTEGEASVLLARMGVTDGNPFYDKDLPIDEFNKVVEELGFEPGAYEVISQYEWHTRSSIHSDLTLKVSEGPISIGAATELFPNGQAWSEYDHSNTYRLIVKQI